MIRQVLRVSLGIFLGCVSLCHMAQAEDGRAFDLNRLPVGKNVTIPGPATTLVPLASTVKFTATDSPQSLKLQAVNVDGGKVAGFAVTLEGEGGKDRKKVELKPDTPFLYSFEELSTVTVVSSSSKTTRQPKYRGLKLKVESNKPLAISR